MRRQFLWCALAAGTMLFGACSKDEVTSEFPGNGPEEGVQNLLLSLDGNEMTMGNGSRAANIGDEGAINGYGRPLFSSRPGQAVDNVLVYFVSAEDETKGKIALLKHIDENTWNNSVTDYAYGKSVMISLKASAGEKLPDGDYTVYAVAYSESNGYSDFLPYKEVNKINNIQISDGTASLKDNIQESFDASSFYVKTDDEASEIFAGTLTVNVAGDKVTTTEKADQVAPGQTAALTLYRQVAGITGYFTNIPVKVNETTPKYIRLVARNANKQLNFVDLGVNAGEKAEVQTNYVVNGASKATGETGVFFRNENEAVHTVYEIDLDNWFVYEGAEGRAAGESTFANCDLSDNAGTGEPDGFVGYGDVKKYLSLQAEKADDYSGFWKNANNGANGFHQGLVRGSVWAGKFVIPFEHSGDAGKPTLELQLLDKDRQILTTWAVNLPATDIHSEVTSGEEGTGTVSTEKTDLSASVYNIYRNHLYSLGMKKGNDGGSDGTDDDDDNPTDPTDPTDPDDDKDNPQDLTTKNSLVLKVNDRWEADHEMEID